MASRACSAGPRRLDVHQSSKILPATHGRYRAAVAKFTVWLAIHGYRPDLPEEYDDLLVEWKVDTNCSKADFEGCLAGCEHALPRLKGNLVWARACLAGWSVTYKTRHTVPLCRGPCHFMACHIAALTHAKLAGGMLIQQDLGLRPSEMLGLQANDISLPEQQTGASGRARAIIGLGMRSGTKAGREQAVVLRDPVLLGLLRWLVATADETGRLVPYSYENYRRILAKAEAAAGLSVGWTPHSPRAGYASDGVAQGKSFVDLREGGRWVCDASLRTYIDVVAAASIATSLKLKSLEPAVVYAVAHILDYLPGSQNFQRSSDFQDGHAPRQRHGEGARRFLLLPGPCVAAEEEEQEGPIHEGRDGSPRIAGRQGHSRPPQSGRGRGEGRRGGRR